MKLRKVISLILLFLIAYTGTLSLITFTMSEPSRKSIPIQEYDTSFWDLALIEDYTTLNVTYTNITLEEYNGKLLKTIELYYTSEIYNNREIRIYGRLIMLNDTTEKRPAIVFCHGFGGNADIYLEAQKMFAHQGYITFAFDAPSANNGRSTPYPDRSAQNVINVTSGPRNSYLYHFILSGFRAVTFIYNHSNVDPSNIFFVGRSLGGVASFVIGAMDDRVKGIVSISAAGNYLQSILSGSLINALIPPNVSLDSIEAKLTLKYFDVYGYARLINKPILMLDTTNDEFFDLYSINDTFAAIKSESKTLSIQPNQEHWGKKEYITSWGKPEWMDIIYNWISATVNNITIVKPSIYDVVSRNLVTYSEVRIVANISEITDDYRVSVYWKENIPTVDWKRLTLKKVGENLFEGSIVSFNSKNIHYYIAIEKNVGNGEYIIVSSSPLFKVETGASTPIIMFLSILIVYLFIFQQDLRLRIQGGNLSLTNNKEVFVTLVSWLLVVTSTVLPWLVIPDRTCLTILVFLERFKYFLNIPEVLIFVFLFYLSLGLPLVIYKPSLSGIVTVPIPILGLLFEYLINKGFSGQIIIALGIGGFIALIGLFVFLFHIAMVLSSRIGKLKKA